MQNISDHHSNGTLGSSDVRAAEARFLPLAEPWYPARYADAVRDQLLSGFIGPGKSCDLFARSLADYIGCRHVVATVSGTVALSVAATALGLESGDAILVPAYGVVSTINAFAAIGLRPRLVDIDPLTGCMNADELKKAFDDDVRAVCYVDFSGCLDDNLLKVVELCRERGLPVIEDAACALGHQLAGRFAGSFGDVGTLSFSVPKVLSTGQGGAIITDRQDIRDRAAAFIDQGDLEWRATNLNRAVGTNLRFNDILGRLGLCQMEDIDHRLARRREVYERLHVMLGSFLYSVPGAEAPLHNIVFADDADLLVGALRGQGIGAVRQYRTLSQHPAYAQLAEGAFPSADWWTEHSVYLPFGMALEPTDAERIGHAVLDAGIPLLPLEVIAELAS